MPYRRCSALIVVVVAVFTVAVRAEPPLRVAPDRQVDIQHIALDLKVDVPAKRVDGRAAIDVVGIQKSAAVRFDAVDFSVSAVAVRREGGRAVTAPYVNDGESIEVIMDPPLARGDAAQVTIEYQLVDPASGLHFFGPTEESPDTPYQVWSQGQAITNRYWIPCFDHPNEFQTTEMTVTTAAGNEVVSNGRLVDKRINADGTVTFHWLQDKPHVIYLVTLVVGDFYVASEEWRGRPVLYYVPEEEKAHVERAFRNTVPMLEYFSELFGVPYPWDKYAQICAEQFGGGMENTSATTLSTRVLHDERAALDYSPDGLIAHELAHQWFGDMVTCRTWAHLWLNEGFASFISPVWDEHHLGRDEYDYDIYRSMQRAIRGGKDRPVVDRHYEHPGQMFDSRAYPKGASILHTLRRRLGDELFWAGVKQYLRTYAYQPVETWQFRRVMEEVSGRALERFFYDWTHRPGAPEVEVAFDWLADEGLAKLHVQQKQKEDAFHFPLEVEFRFDEGDPVRFTRDITEKDVRFFFALPQRPGMVVIDPRDAVLMTLTEKKGRDLWERQLAAAPNVTARIRAAAYFGKSGRPADVETLQQALMGESFWGVASEIADALGEAGGEAARDALLAGLTLEHPKARRACAEQLGDYHGDEKVAAALRELIEKGDPSYGVESAAIRAYGKTQPPDGAAFLLTLLDRESHRDQIRRAVLSALGDQGDPSAVDALLAWSRKADDAFTRVTALAALGDIAKEGELHDEQVSEILDRAVAVAEAGGRWASRAAFRTLGDLGELARPALPRLRSIASTTANHRAKEAAERAIEQITKASPVPSQVADMQERIDALARENETLQSRLEKLELMLEAEQTAVR